MKLLDLFMKILKLKDDYIHLDNDASYFTARNGDSLYIYFQWSNSKIDWINNFKFAATSITTHSKAYKNMEHPWYVHRGFLSVWEVIEPFIQRELWDPEIKNVTISGYSHGSPIALLCHEYVRFHRPDVKVQSYGFAGPRAIWGPIPKEVKKRFEGFTLIRNRADIVTHVPPILFGYRNVGKMITIGKHKVLPLTISAHLEASYIEALKQEEENDREHSQS